MGGDADEELFDAMAGIGVGDSLLVVGGEKSQPFLAAGDVAAAGILTDQKRVGGVKFEMAHQGGDDDVAMIVDGVLPELKKRFHELAANSVGVAAIGGDAAYDAGGNGLGRQQVLGAEHQAIPVGRNILEKFRGLRREIFDGIGIIFQDEQRLDAVFDRGFENRAVRQQASPCAGAFVPTGGDTDGLAVDGLESLGGFEGPLAQKLPEPRQPFGAAVEIDDNNAIEEFGKILKAIHGGSLFLFSMVSTSRGG